MKTAWRGLRRLVALVRTLFWLAVLAALAAWAWSQRTPALLERTVLVLRLDGAIVEQAGTPASGPSPATVPLRAILQALEQAARDPDIASVLLQLDGLSGGGLAVQRELAAALVRFRASGKKVVAWGLAYDPRSYAIAAHADEVYLHPMGAVLIDGPGRARSLEREALERPGPGVWVLRPGRPRTPAEAAADAGDADGLLHRALWATYQEGIEKARRLPAGHLQKLVDGLPDSLVAADGDLARLALDARLVDGLMTPDALRTLLADRGARDERSRSFRQIGLDDYLQRLPPPREADGVALVVVDGEIVDGPGGPGRVGGGVTAERLRRAREAEAVKAVVLRVSSPGGSALGSELIRRELQLTRAAGKPVIVSMGDLAASGGYWLGMSADEIIADPATVTGGIGVVGLLPSATGPGDKAPGHGSAVSWLADAADARRPADPRLVRLVQAAVDHAYADFSAKAAAARRTTREKIEAVAQGRLWTGAQAKERGLVDRLGGLSDALAAARTRARLPADAPVLAADPDVGERRLGQRLIGRLSAALGRPGAALPAPGPAAAPEDPRALLARLASGRPWSAVAHCLCRADP